MSDTVIRAEGLSKQFHIGSKQEKYKTLRDTLTEAALGPFRIIRHALRRSNEQSANGGSSFWALKDISFEVKRGEVVGIIGRNGAGKSTLLKVLSRIIDPTEGYVDIQGRVGALLEVGTGFHPELTGRENIFLNGAILGMKKTEIVRNFDDIVTFAEVEKFIDTPVKHYSSGMYLRLAFAVAAYMEPEILIVDEVLAVGDAAFQKKCLGKMGDVVNQGRTVLFVSHNLAAITNLCDRILLIENGRVKADTSAEEALALYLGNQSEAVNNLAERQDREGSGVVRFKNLSMQDAGGGEIDVVQAGSEVNFALDYVAPGEQPLRNVITEIKVSDHFGGLLFTLSTYLLGNSFETLQSHGTVYCKVPQMLLAPGIYNLNLLCIVNGELADRVENAGEFTVVEGDYFNSGKVPTRKQHGPFLIPHSWHSADNKIVKRVSV